MNTPAPGSPYTGPTVPAPYPPVPMEMPGGVRTARVCLWVLGGLSTLGGLIFTAVAAFAERGDSEFSRAGLAGIAVLSLVLGVASLVLAAKFRTGGNGVRVGALVVSGVVLLNALVSLASGAVVGGPGIALGALVLVNCVKKDGVGWFKRPRA
ncbi:hypothetical protein M1P56_27570 [Streptomyces sp. HU2014]|uniref:Uncharacterized protein n=1 Tax=Streptomyces albireticuli TaxID=1940 RepID=A0A1Z2L0T4_9ACTN|nr:MULTISPECIES: hypothetical protein [Streptomyces]ARZ67831.1 hypothetical protein SMD11_2179 [Streptomyces albireticuli]UQI47828.1 hypothetical protein M1P56_27570 [Streptomyces sp. HU2014]